MKYSRSVLLLCAASVFYIPLALASQPAKLDSIPGKVIAAALSLKDDGKPLPVPRFKDEAAMLSGHLKGYHPKAGDKPLLIYDNPITGEHVEVNLAIDPSGNFKVSVPVVSATEVLFWKFSPYNGKILLEPGKETVLYADLDQTDQSKRIIFTGPYADVNNQYYRYDLSNHRHRFLSPKRIYEFIDQPGTTSEMLRSYVVEQVKKGIEDLQGNTALFLKTRQLAEIDLKTGGANWLANLDLIFRIEQEQNRKIKLPDFNAHLYSALKELDINHYQSLYTSSFSDFINNGNGIPDLVNRHFVKIRYVSNKNLERLNADYRLSDQEKEVLLINKKRNPDNWSASHKQWLKNVAAQQLSWIRQQENLPDNMDPLIVKLDVLVKSPTVSARRMLDQMADISLNLDPLGIRLPTLADYTGKEDDLIGVDPITMDNFDERFAEETASFRNNEAMDDLFSVMPPLIGSNTGIFFDLSISRIFTKKMVRQNTPLNRYDLPAIAKIKDPAIRAYIEKLDKKILNGLSSTAVADFRVHEISKSTTDADALLKEITSKFNGKAIYIDLWATWCGPCIAAMKQYEPSKASFKTADVAFVYLTDESSPVKLWQNMIREIPGEHFRMDSKVLNLLKIKYRFTGIPAYLVIDKKGNVIYDHIGFSGIDKTNEIIKKAME
ncbi:TlpA family protein disulfide reductase [Pedobacter metabolipauper]|uniref:Thiol-disulfide isomerase/thioredoxin n=1 Tax=Pedobacter metabolipauper TaxID=425513 RepID=A0A4R6T132_9SPHI|nr:TlpA disulfide reductase family protein [Pedobacter metabolipauper]TDQ11190.1 thiol-disulfide isomerase/thioredoxin [Pedobacter metabolipauper]